MASVTIRMSDDMKQQLELIFENMGMNMTTGMTIYAKAVLRQGKIPFEIVSDPFWSEPNQERLRQSIAQHRAGKATEHELIEVDDEDHLD